MHIFSSSSKNTQVDFHTLLTNTCQKSENKSRVSTSQLNTLLKSIKNSPENFSLQDFKKTHTNITKLVGIINQQNSHALTLKGNKISELYTLSQQKLSPEARSERQTNLTKNLTNKITHALDTIASNMDKLERNVSAAQIDIRNTVYSLPTKESQIKATFIIENRNYSLFGKDTAITNSLFPARWESVEREYGYRQQKFDHPSKETWVSLKSQGEALDKANKMVARAHSFLQSPNNLVFDAPTSTGKIELTPHQVDLLQFAKMIAK
nr:hypothetical protein [uncultured Enterobacter sp.]